MTFRVARFHAVEPWGFPVLLGQSTALLRRTVPPRRAIHTGPYTGGQATRATRTSGLRTRPTGGL